MRDTKKRLAVAVMASGTTTTEIFGVGPVIAATVIGYAAGVSRFGSRARFAADNGTAPIGVSSGKARCRLSFVAWSMPAADGGTVLRGARTDGSRTGACSRTRPSRPVSCGGREAERWMIQQGWYRPARQTAAVTDASWRGRGR